MADRVLDQPCDRRDPRAAAAWAKAGSSDKTGWRLAAGQPLTFEGVATSPVGTQAYLVTKGVYRDRDGRILGIFGISHDVTELRQANEALERTREARLPLDRMRSWPSKTPVPECRPR